MKWASRLCSRASAALNEHACDACDGLSVHVLGALVDSVLDSVPWWLGEHLSVFAVPQQVSRCDVMRACPRVSTLSVCSAAGVLKLTVRMRLCFVKVVRGRGSRHEGEVRARGALFYEFRVMRATQQDVR